MSGTAYNSAFWAAMPWVTAPTKINANTGTFGQLWSAYWSVMQDSPDSNGNYPTGAPGTTTQTDLSVQQFRNPIRNTTLFTTLDPFTGQKIPELTRTQMIQLRAALAAVNTIDMRDGDEDITSRTVALTAPSGATLYANVFGAEKQPYITEVVIDYEPNQDQNVAAAIRCDRDLQSTSDRDPVSQLEARMSHVGRAVTDPHRNRRSGRDLKVGNAVADSLY